MRIVAFRVFALFIGVVILFGCGTDNGPNVSDPWTGSAGNLWVSELTAQDHDSTVEKFWVGFDSSGVWSATLQRLQNNSNQQLIVSGKIVPTQTNSAGFTSSLPPRTPPEPVSQSGS